MTTRRVYSADVRIWGTLYVVAKNQKEARKMMRARLGNCIEVGTNDEASDLMFSNPDLPDEHFSPCMTIEKRQRLRINLADDCEMDDEDEECEQDDQDDD